MVDTTEIIETPESKGTLIRISWKVYKYLDKLGERRESFDSVLRRLLEIK